MVVPVDDDHLGIDGTESRGRRQPAKAGADDDDPRPRRHAARGGGPDGVHVPFLYLLRLPTG